jgi:hypothetical protein
MRTDRVYISIVAFSATICARADDLPTKLNFDRYKAMLDHSPFAVATAVVAPAATPNFAKDLYVANAARSPEGTMCDNRFEQRYRLLNISDHKSSSRRLRNCRY